MNLPKFKIRASACGKIMGRLQTISENQIAEMRSLEQKTTALTARQETLLPSLQVKYKKHQSAKPSDKLPETAKTYLQEWIKEQVYGRRKNIDSKYLDKGNACESEALNMIMEYYDMPFGYEKNTVRKENDHMSGECDLHVERLDLIVDSKCSFDCFTFPLFKQGPIRPNDDYFYQGQVYLDLWKVKNYALCYVLTNTSEDIVGKEIYYKTKGMLDHPAGLLADKIRESHRYDHVPMDKRIKRFDFTYDESVIQRIVARVELCRKYITEITGSIS